MRQLETNSEFYERVGRRRVLAPRRMTLLVMLAVATIGLSTLADGQETWQVDTKSSFARLQLGSGSNALEIGLARVSGQVIFESSATTDPRVQLSINPADGSHPAYAEMNFTSKRAAISDDGRLVFAGDLTVTHVQRSIVVEPNEAYHGAEYGEPVVSLATREIKLVVSHLHLAHSQSTESEFFGSAIVSQEDFPQLLDILEQVNWPTVLVNDAMCQAPPVVGEDYHGTICTGTVITSVQNYVAPTGSASGEGYYGFLPLTSADRSHSMIVLDLKLKEMPRVSSFTKGASTAAEN
jgi:hypothetical protein